MPDLKIQKIDVFQVNLPYSGGVYLLSGGREYRSFDATIVRVTTNTGIEGWAKARRGVRPMSRPMRWASAQKSPRLRLHSDRSRSAASRPYQRGDGLCAGRPRTTRRRRSTSRAGTSSEISRSQFRVPRRPDELRMPIISSIYVGDPDEMRRRVAEHRAKGYIGHSVKVGDRVRPSTPNVSRLDG